MIGPEPIVIESELTQADWSAWQSAWLGHARARIGQVRAVVTVLLPVLAGLLVLFVWRGEWRSIPFFAFMVGAVAYFFSVMLTQRLYQRVMQPLPNAWFLGRVRVELSPEGIRTVRAHTDTATRWSAVRDVTRSTAHVYVWLDSLSAYVLPIRDLPDGVDTDQLMTWVRARFESAPAHSSTIVPPLAESDPAGPFMGEPAAPPSEPRGETVHSPIGFARALWQRLRWRPLPENVGGSTDAVIACCAALALAVWLAFDRHAAGPGAYWYPSGVSDLAWYVLGLVGLAWVLYRAADRSARYRSFLAALAGVLPLALVLGLSIRQWALPAWQPLAYVLLGWILFFYAHRTLAVTTGAPRPLALATGVVCVALFAWGTRKAWIEPHLWYSAESDEEKDGDDSADDERLLFEQADRIDEAAARVAPGRPGRPDVFFLGFAGVAEQKVFAEEVKLSESVVAARYGAAGRSLLLVNDRRDREAQPFATVSGLGRALARVGERMDREEDVLFLLLTSHGDDTPSLSVSNGTLPLAALDGESLREALDASGIRWRVVVISACHSGAFIEHVADENTIVVTSAAADRTSFGCSDDRDVTDFGAAFVRDALPEAESLAAAFESAKGVIEKQERAAGLTPSSPQAHFGRAISARWTAIEAERR